MFQIICSVSGFESKAVKYGEDEETFSLQRAETGDHRINREHQSNHVDQNKDARINNQRPSKQNNNYNNRNKNNDNSEKDIFKGSSSSNFFNNRNNGKERDEDYDDNVNVNQDKDYETRRKVVRNKVRRPVQNYENNNENNRNNDYNRNNGHNGNNDNNRNNDYNRNNEYNRNRNTNNRNSEFEARKTDIQEQQNRRTTKPVTFNNNYAGSSYLPTTAKPSSTTLNNEQYTTAINNYRSRNGQKQRQYTPEYESSSTPVYTVSTPAPFKQTHQYNAPPSRPANIPVTENYPQQKPVSKSTTTFDEHYDIPKVKPTTLGQNYNAQYDTQKTKQTASTAAQSSSTQYDVPKTKQTPSTFSTQYDVTKSKPTTADQVYETTKVKQNSFPTKTTPYEKTENYPSNNPVYSSTIDKKSTAKQVGSYPTTLSPKPFSNFPSTFAPRTNAGYTEIAHQTISYTKNSQSTAFSQYSSSQAAKETPKNTNSNNQYTPTVPKLSSTTPVSR